jgi:predicted ATP-grasp superfamily ATP-dependent carboligase
MRERGDVYDLEEIVSDAFSICIINNKMHIAFYLYRQYREAVLGNKQLCIEALIAAFKNDYQTKSKILHLEERLFILEKFLSYIDYKGALEVLECFNELFMLNEDSGRQS